jgi:hypothetical protein
MYFDKISVVCILRNVDECCQNHVSANVHNGAYMVLEENNGVRLPGTSRFVVDHSTNIAIKACLFSKVVHVLIKYKQ